MGSPVCRPCWRYECANWHGSAPDPNFGGMAPCTCTHENKRTRSDEEIREAADQIKAEVLEDIGTVTNHKGETMPHDVGSFSQLHDYVGLCDPDQRADWSLGDQVAVQDEVDAWLKHRKLMIHHQSGEDEKT